MDKLVTTAKEEFWNAEAYARDRWVQKQAQTLRSGSWVLDAGAGASKYRPFFQHCRYETQDFCQYEGKLVKYVEPINYVCDITAIPLPSACLDAVLCTEVLEHVPDPVAVLKEFSRLLKVGGRLFVTAPFVSASHMEPYHFYSGFTCYWYRHWLPKHGLAVDETTAMGGPGRTCVVFAQLLYSLCGEAERPLTGFRRFRSKFLRALAKGPVHVLLPRLLPRLDPWLGTDQVCSTYLVAATRLDTQSMV